MKKKFVTLFLLIPLFSLTACFNSGDVQAPSPVPAPPATVSPTQSGMNAHAPTPSIDSQIQDLNQHNGTINPQDQQKLNNNPVVPDAFKQ